MKTTKEDHEFMREHAVRSRYPNGLFARLTADLDRLAAIEGARAKGGLTSGERAIVPETQGIIIRLDDALRAANEELGRVRGMLQYAGTTAHIRSCHCEECSKIRAYLAEVEASDGK